MNREHEEKALAVRAAAAHMDQAIRTVADTLGLTVEANSYVVVEPETLAVLAEQSEARPGVCQTHVTLRVGALLVMAARPGALAQATPLWREALGLEPQEVEP